MKEQIAFRRIIFLLTICACLCTSASCDDAPRSSSTDDGAANIVVLAAPVAGIVRRVLVREGVNVAADAPVIEIETEVAAAPVTNTSAAEREARARAAAQNNATTNQQEVERAAIEVQRMEALVRQNAAPPAQLDAARAVYQRAQERSQRPAAIAANARAADPAATPATDARAASQIVTVRATTAGSLRVVSVRPGQRVAAGQPVATLAAND